MTSDNIPDTPTGVPKTLAQGIQRQDEESIVDVITYAQELIEYLEQPVEDNLTDEDEELLKTEEGEENWTKVVKRIPCGKNCSGCPHGPYLYFVRRETVDKLEWEYIGPVADEEDDDELEDDDDRTRMEELDEEDDEEDDDDEGIDGAVEEDETVYPDKEEDDEEDEEVEE